ncbi:hypothetical protein ACIGJO_18010 [Streptomyces sp. NPDC079020]|uniref:Secreted protein n=1 Tax=Streptomyces atratus TaxID=1893 RepID=A0A1K2F1X4_STRAR|nr:hypothetical protein [Streptomyces atratus]SFY41745.1 hypothetical protein SAMN02787144_102854 [Streptomyces atratus]
MKKTALLAVPLALAAGLALAPAASAAPDSTPALRCSQAVDLAHVPPGNEAFYDAVQQLARKSGLPGVPKAVGITCRGERTLIDGGTNAYLGSGPVILRGAGISPLQEYCTQSVSVPVLYGDGRFPTVAIIGSDCTSEADPIAV